MPDAFWCDAAGWKDRWKATSTVGKGRHCVGHAARLLDGTDATPRFLKVLKPGGGHVPEQQLHNEARILAALAPHPAIPRLIETNAQRHAAPEGVELYLVAELIPGPTLEGLAASGQRLTEDAALALTERLLDAVAHCHGRGYVHCDVKPENIILRGGDPADPVLVDFNRAVHVGGDRPAGAPADLLPQAVDPRTDLTQVARILFWGLTGQFHLPLRDWNGRAPHQRPQEKGGLRGRQGPRAQALRQFFDRAFALRIEHRFQSAAEFRAALHPLRQVAAPGKAEAAARRVKGLSSPGGGPAAPRHRPVPAA